MGTRREQIEITIRRRPEEREASMEDRYYWIVKMEDETRIIEAEDLHSLLRKALFSRYNIREVRFDVAEIDKHKSKVKTSFPDFIIEECKPELIKNMPPNTPYMELNGTFNVRRDKYWELKNESNIGIRVTWEQFQRGEL